MGTNVVQLFTYQQAAALPSIHGLGGLDGFAVKPWDPDYGGLKVAKAADPG